MAKIERKQGDTVTIAETFERPSDGTPLDLTDAQSVKIYVAHPSSGDLVVNDSVTIADAANGKVNYQLSGTQTARGGQHRIEYVAEFAGGETFTYPQSGFVSANFTEPVNRDLPVEELADGDASLTTLFADDIQANTAPSISVQSDVDHQGNNVTGIGEIGASTLADTGLAGEIDTAQLSDDAVTAAKVAAAAVDSGAIAADAVGVDELAAALGTTSSNRVSGTTHFEQSSHEALEADTTSIGQLVGKAELQASQTISSDTITQVDLDTTIYEDPDVVTVDLTNNQIISEVTGTFMIISIIKWNSSADWNQGDEIAIAGNELFYPQIHPGNSTTQCQTQTSVVKVDSGDALTLQCRQRSGVDQIVGNNSTQLQVVRLG